MRVVLDTSAVYAALTNEPDSLSYETAIAAADACLISALSVFEAQTVLYRRFGMEKAARLDDFLAGIEAAVQPFDDDMVPLAFAAYRKFGRGSAHAAQLNYADCASYALAKALDLPLLFKGDDFARTDVTPALPLLLAEAGGTA